ncbi:MAG: hypothetical protein ACJAWV_002018 [Flammeovirgaceae bacterium]|jgi:hypothetical protein
MKPAFRLKPQIRELIVLALVLGAFYGVEMVYPDIFRNSDFWVNVGRLLCFGSLAVVLFSVYFSFRHKNGISFLSFVNLALSVVLIWYVFDSANPETQFRKKKEAYIGKLQESDNFTSSFMSWEMSEDFLTGEPVANRLFKDKAVIDSLAKDLQIRKKWHNLGKGLYYDQFQEQALICYASWKGMGLSDSEIMDRKFGVNVLSGLFFSTFQLGGYEIHSKVKPHFEKFKKNLNSNLRRVVAKKMEDLDALSFYEMEMLIYFLTQRPIQVPQAKFDKLMALWIAEKPAYEKNLEQLAMARNILKGEFSQLGRRDSIGISFNSGSTPEEWAFKDMKPIFNLTGYQTYLGNEIELTYSTSSEKLIERKESIYKQVRKTRKVIDYSSSSTHKRYTGTRYKTERYTESVYDRTETTQIYKNTVNLLIEDKMLIFNLPKFLPHQYMNVETKQYNIPYNQMNRFEYWVFALPQKWFCSSCEDY